MFHRLNHLNFNDNSFGISCDNKQSHHGQVTRDRNIKNIVLKIVFFCSETPKNMVFGNIFFQRINRYEQF